ncbi:MAG: Uncharacterised protein [Gammaproteobacteria bacterium]|nr:MAG: Uncharacterised protein [Gammaproteobacteria bacterium]
MIKKNILFLCSGNYFRSRFAELWFNHEADQRRLPWYATSAGLLMENNNQGNISEYTRTFAHARGWTVPNRPPIAASKTLFDYAERVIALKEAEHRQPIELRFPEYTDKVMFWSIHDEDVMKPSDILPLLESQLIQFVETLS